MRILLVNPGYSCFEPAKVVHLGLAYVAAYLETAGHDVSVVDLFIEQESKFEELVKEHSVIGFTATTMTISSVIRLARRARELNPSAKIVFGGPHPSCDYTQIIEKDFCDVVVIGEGEETAAELMETFEDKKDLEEVRGIAFKRGKEVIVTKPRALIKDLDTLPRPAYHLFPDLDNYTSYVPHKKRRSAGIVSSRGCPYNCVYCFKGVFGRVWRPRSPESVVAEWEWLVKEKKVKEIAITDDVFNLSMERANKIYDMVLERGLRIPHLFPNGIRADFVDRELLAKMKKAGCFRVAFGVETGSKKIMDSLGKNLSFEKVRKAFKLCRELGIETTGFFILGLPGDTRETMQQTIDFAKELDPDFAQFTILSPYAGTRVYDMIKKEGKIFQDWNIEFAGHYDKSPKFILGGVTPELTSEMRARAYKEFYMRPSRMWKNLKHISWENVKHVLWYMKKPK